MMINILEHSSSSYAPRTYVNASVADVTVAIAIDYTTAGEELTHKVAGDKYLALPFDIDWIDNARTLYKHMVKYNCKSINVAGNSIHTLKKHSICQEAVNQIVYNILDTVNYHWGIDYIRSGGQTGADLAGGVAGYILGVETTMLLPKGFKQRHEDGVDRFHSLVDIENQIKSWEPLVMKVMQ